VLAHLSTQPPLPELAAQAVAAPMPPLQPPQPLSLHAALAAWPVKATHKGVDLPLGRGVHAKLVPEKAVAQCRLIQHGDKVWICLIMHTPAAVGKGQLSRLDQQPNKGACGQRLQTPPPRKV
jgi:hypothetical protein